MNNEEKNIEDSKNGTANEKDGGTKLPFFKRIAKSVKDLFSRPYLRIFKNKFFLTGLFFFIVTVFVMDNNAIRWAATKYEVYQQERQKRFYQQEIENLREKIDNLENKDSLEKFAREKYFFHEEDEQVFIVK